MHPAAQSPLCCGMRTQTAALAMQGSRRHTTHTYTENMLILQHVRHNSPPKPTSTQPVAAASHMLNSNPDTEPASQHMRLARTVQRPPETHQHTACGRCTICLSHQARRCRTPCTTHVPCNHFPEPTSTACGYYIIYPAQQHTPSHPLTTHVSCNRLLIPTAHTPLSFSAPQRQR
jgi:hypothetical protein